MEIIDFLSAFLNDPLTIIQDLIHKYDYLIYLILFIVVFAETGFVFMPLLPGDSLLFAIGVIAASTGQLSMSIIIPLLIIAALLGDNLNYFVGNKFGNLIKKRKKLLFLKKEYITHTETFFEKNGGKAIIMARFVPVLRTIAPFVAGAGSMPYLKYIVFCVLGAFIWVTSLTFLGYFLGQVVWVKENFDMVILIITVLSVSPVIIKALKKKFAKK